MKARKKMNVRSRNKFIDLIKGFAIILVVAGHCIQSGCGGQYSASNIYWENYLFKFIYGFHMPLFAMVSGYLFYYSVQKRNFIGIVCQRIMTIGIPIAIWCGIMLIVDYRDIAFGGVINFLSYYRVVLGSSLWFLWALLGSSFLVIGNKFFFRDTMAVYVVFLIVSPFLSDAHYLGAVKFLYPYFTFGYLLHRSGKWNIMQEKFWENKKRMIFILLIAYVAMLPIFHYDTYFYTTGITLLGKQNVWYQLWNDVIRLIAGFVGSFATIGSIACVVQLTKKKIWCKLLDVAALLGQYTMGIYIINWQTMPLLQKMTRELSYSIGLVVIETIITTAVCWGIAVFLYRIKGISGLLFGKWNIH